MATHKPNNCTEEDRLRRAKAVEDARISVFMEGFVTSEADNALAQRFINGDITLEEYANHHDAEDR